jgi:hypothetical protein
LLFLRVRANPCGCLLHRILQFYCTAFCSAMEVGYSENQLQIVGYTSRSIALQ